MGSVVRAWDSNRLFGQHNIAKYTQMVAAGPALGDNPLINFASPTPGDGSCAISIYKEAKEDSPARLPPAARWNP